MNRIEAYANGSGRHAEANRDRRRQGRHTPTGDLPVSARSHEVPVLTVAVTAAAAAAGFAATAGAFAAGYANG